MALTRAQALLLDLNNAGSQGFTPASIPGQLLWVNTARSTLYQDSARTTLVAADGDPVGSWTDLSGQGNHLAQVTAGKRPLYKTNILNGLAVVRFDGVSSFLTKAFTFVQPESIFIVMKPTSIAGNAVFDGVTGLFQMWFSNNGGNLDIYAGSGHAATTTFTGGAFSAFVAVFNGASSSLTNAGTRNTGNPGAQSGGGLVLGSSAAGLANGNPDVAELAVYPSAFSTAQIDGLLSYAYRTYALTGSLL